MKSGVYVCMIYIWEPAKGFVITSLLITLYSLTFHFSFYQKYTLRHLKAMHAYIENLETADKDKQTNHPSPYTPKQYC